MSPIDAHCPVIAASWRGRNPGHLDRGFVFNPVAPGLAIGEAQFAELIDTCRHLDAIDRAAAGLISLTIPS